MLVEGVMLLFVLLTLVVFVSVSASAIPSIRLRLDNAKIEGVAKKVDLAEETHGRSPRTTYFSVVEVEYQVQGSIYRTQNWIPFDSQSARDEYDEQVDAGTPVSIWYCVSDPSLASALQPSWWRALSDQLGCSVLCIASVLCWLVVRRRRTRARIATSTC